MPAQLRKPRKRGFLHAARFGRNTPHFTTAAFLIFILGVLGLSGCSPKPLSKDETRTVTSEIVDAARRASNRSGEITIEPQPAGGRRTVDHVSVTLTSDEQLRSLRASLWEIAGRHHLELTESGTDLPRFVFKFHSETTHSVEITIRLGHVEPTASRPRSSGPRLAIIIDDLGEDRTAADELLALHFPLTLSVLPNLTFSSAIAEAAHQHQDEVMLHLPMESQGEREAGGDAKPEPEELRIGMPAGEVSRRVAEMLGTVPFAAGVNNHQGSLATSDPALMAAVMESLHGRNLFFIDSRTTADTVAYDTAERFGVKAASRKVFLDDKLSPKAIAAQLEVAAQDAQRNGSAIAIGHPHPQTIAVLRSQLPRLKKRGIELTFPSELVH